MLSNLRKIIIKDKFILYLLSLERLNTMASPSNSIVFTLVYLNEAHLIQTFLGEYRDLRALIVDKIFPEDFGQCGGMGRCATCMVEIAGFDSWPEIYQRNEATTLSRLDNKDLSVRLSCQMPVDTDLANRTIRVLESQ
jgi:ferredoxin, 2Fe-2S